MHEPLFRIAARQHGVVLRRQLLAAGMSHDAIVRRIAAGWLVPVLPGAYCVRSTPVLRQQRVVAAVLLNPGAAADGEDAARTLGLETPKMSRTALLRDEREPVRIALQHAHRDRTDGVIVRRQLHRERNDVVRRFGIAVIAPHRLVIDMAGRMPYARVERLLDTALAGRQTTMDDLIRRHLQLPRQGRKGVAAVDRLIDLRVDGRHRKATQLEATTRRLLVAAGYPEPERQHRVVLPNGKERFLDLALPHLRIAIEVDGYRWHSSRTDWAADQVRANELVALGWRILRVTDEVLASPAGFLSQVAALAGLAA